jgi:hypothetical protein
MTPTHPIRATSAHMVFAGLATLVLVLAACGSTNPPASPSASVSSSTRAPTATPAVTGIARPATTPSATVATPSSGPVTTLPPAADRPQTIHVLEDPGQFTFGHVGSVTGCNSAACQGDTMIGRSRMLDAATREGIGTFLVNCVLIDVSQTLYHCPANTITLTGRGQIVFTETLLWGGGGPGQDTWATWAPWPIIGGTGEFLGATGTVDSPADSTWSAGDFVITITESTNS